MIGIFPAYFWAMMIDSQVTTQFLQDMVSTVLNLHQRSPDEGLKKSGGYGYHAAYETPYDMLH
jgi:hypothetical protein